VKNCIKITLFTQKMMLRGQEKHCTRITLYVKNNVIMLLSMSLIIQYRLDKYKTQNNRRFPNGFVAMQDIWYIIYT